MIVNGYLVVIISSGTGLSENGDPVPVEEISMPAVPCNIDQVSHKLKDSESGRFTDAQYEILVIGKVDDNCKKVEIRDVENELIGQFEVIEREFLSFVQRTRLTV